MVPGPRDHRARARPDQPADVERAKGGEPLQAAAARGLSSSAGPTLPSDFRAEGVLDARLLLVNLLRQQLQILDGILAAVGFRQHVIDVHRCRQFADKLLDFPTDVLSRTWHAGKIVTSELRM